MCVYEWALEGFFFLSSGEFWIFLCHGSPASSHFLPTRVTYKPAVISLQISNTARSKYIYFIFVCFFFFSLSHRISRENLFGLAIVLPSWTPVRAKAFPPLLLSWKDNSEFWISLSLFTVIQVSCLSSWTRQFVFPLFVMADKINCRRSSLQRRSSSLRSAELTDTDRPVRSDATHSSWIAFTDCVVKETWLTGTWDTERYLRSSNLLH